MARWLKARGEQEAEAEESEEAEEAEDGELNSSFAQIPSGPRRRAPSAVGHWRQLALLLLGAAGLATCLAAGGRPARLAEPEQDNELQRVAVGRSVRFKCTVDDLGAHKLAWFHSDARALLGLNNMTLSRRSRVEVSAQADKVFFLQINSVQLSDKVSSGRWLVCALLANWPTCWLLPLRGRPPARLPAWRHSQVGRSSSARVIVVFICAYEPNCVCCLSFI